MAEPEGKKNFKLRITAEADKFAGNLGKKDLDAAAKDWYNTVGKASLERHFNEVLGEVVDNSYLKNFTFSDTVVKEPQE